MNIPVKVFLFGGWQGAGSEKPGPEHSGKGLFV